MCSIQSSIQSLSHVQLFGTLWTAAHQASLSITNSQSLLKLTSIELVMPSSHLIFRIQSHHQVCWFLCLEQTATPYFNGHQESVSCIITPGLD